MEKHSSSSPCTAPECIVCVLGKDHRNNTKELEPHSQLHRTCPMHCQLSNTQMPLLLAALPKGKQRQQTRILAQIPKTYAQQQSLQRT
jgi:hypothetical protein